MTDCLFIGGRVDGRRQAVMDTSDRVYFNILEPLSLCYRRINLYSPGNEYFVFMLDKIPDNQVIEALIDGYRKENK